MRGEFCIPITHRLIFLSYQKSQAVTILQGWYFMGSSKHTPCARDHWIPPADAPRFRETSAALAGSGCCPPTLFIMNLRPFLFALLLPHAFVCGAAAEEPEIVMPAEYAARNPDIANWQARLERENPDRFESRTFKKGDRTVRYRWFSPEPDDRPSFACGPGGAALPGCLRKGRVPPPGEPAKGTRTIKSKKSRSVPLGPDVLISFACGPGGAALPGRLQKGGVPPPGEPAKGTRTIQSKKSRSVPTWSQRSHLFRLRPRRCRPTWLLTSLRSVRALKHQELLD